MDILKIVQSSLYIKILILIATLPFVVGFIFGFIRSFLMSFKITYSKGLTKQSIREVFKKSISLKEIFKTDRRHVRKVDRLFRELLTITEKIDIAINDIKLDIETRQNALRELKARNSELVDEEKFLQERVNALKSTPIEVAEYFNEINRSSLRSEGRRSFLRDIFLFALGVLVSIILAILFSK